MKIKTIAHNEKKIDKLCERTNGWAKKVAKIAHAFCAKMPSLSRNFERPNATGSNLIFAFSFMRCCLKFFAPATFVIFAFFSCKSTEQEIPKIEEKTNIAATASTEEKTEALLIQENFEVPEKITPEPDQQQEPLVPEILSAPEIPSEEILEYQRSVQALEDKSISMETYIADKEAIMKKISQLNTVMAKKDYNAWLKYIDKNSQTYWSNISNLTKYSEKLPKEAHGLKLQSLKDYFNYVFIPSRRGRTIHEIRYISSNSIKAVQTRKKEDGTPEVVIFYNFIKSNDDWKIFLPRL